MTSGLYRYVAQVRDENVCVLTTTGIEGLAWDPDSGLYYAAQEDTPQRLLAVRPDGSYSDLVPGLNVSAALGLRDLSGLHYVSQLRRLLVLSQESNAIVVLQLPSGKVLQRRGGILTGYRPEGITATPDGRMLFVVAEPDVLAVFKPDQCD